MLEEVEEGGSDWLNGFFTFLYGFITPLEPLEELDDRAPGRIVEPLEEEDDNDEDEDDDEGRARRRGMKDSGNQGQKIVIVGLHNQ